MLRWQERFGTNTFLLFIKYYYGHQMKMDGIAGHIACMGDKKWIQYFSRIT